MQWIMVGSASQRPRAVAWAAGKSLGFGGSGKGLECALSLARAAGVPIPAFWGFARFKIPDKYTLTGRDLLGRQGFLAPRFGGLRLCGAVSALAR